MTQLQQARYDGMMRRLGDLKGGGSKVSEVLSEVFPVVDLENVPAENRILNGWSLGFGATNMLPVAANNNIAQLFNPAGSGKLVVPELILVTASQPGAQQIEFDTDSAPAPDFFATSKPRDTRSGLFAPLVAEIRQQTIPGSLPPIGLIVVLDNIMFEWKDLDGLFVLGPGTGLNVGTTLVNTTLTVTFHWRERIAEPSELNF